ncbi:MAG: hypothetical protein KIT76_16055 [Pseudolabrys sp.]|nr:hypothetical protein [Pseudolabrys sp.]
MSHTTPLEYGSVPAESLRDEMHRALEKVGRELEKLEILAAAMAAFSRPVPDYEPGFQHQRHLTASATVLRNRPSL